MHIHYLYTILRYTGKCVIALQGWIEVKIKESHGVLLKYIQEEFERMLLVYITHDFTREERDNTTTIGDSDNNDNSSSSICYRREVLLAAVHMLLDCPLTD